MAFVLALALRELFLLLIHSGEDFGPARGFKDALVIAIAAGGKFAAHFLADAVAQVGMPVEKNAKYFP